MDLPISVAFYTQSISSRIKVREILYFANPFRIKFKVTLNIGVTDVSVKVSSEFYCGSYKVYLNFWVTDFGGCDRVQIKANISVFGWGCPSPIANVFEAIAK